jgi:hypothetical protein
MYASAWQPSLEAHGAIGILGEIDLVTDDEVEIKWVYRAPHLLGQVLCHIVPRPKGAASTCLVTDELPRVKHEQVVQPVQSGHCCQQGSVGVVIWLNSHHSGSIQAHCKLVTFTKIGRDSSVCQSG